MNSRISKKILCSIECLRGEYFYKYLKELELNEKLDSISVHKLREEKVSNLLDFTLKNNKYYKQKFKSYNVNKFEELPILTKNELRENYNHIRSTPKKYFNRLDLVETSGSTGIPLQLYRDRVTFGYNLASLYRAHKWWGLDVGTKEAMLWGVPVSFTGKIKTRAKDLILNRFREKDYNINSETFTDFYSKILSKKPMYIFGYSSMIFEFSIFLHSNNITLHDTSIKCVICTAEKLHDFKKKKMMKVFGCPVVSEYGATETGLISYDCPAGGTHVFDDTVLLEIVDGNNFPMPDGESGKVLVTVLHSHMSPIVRYELGDISSKKIVQCKCELPFTTLGEIEGRTSDIVISPDGSVYHSIIFYYIVKDLVDKIGGIQQFKVHQRRVDLLDFYLVKNEFYSGEVDSYIQKQITDKFGGKMNLKIIYVDALDRSLSGKLKDFETDLDTETLLNDLY